jgi:hypothetical protein
LLLFHQPIYFFPSFIRSFVIYFHLGLSFHHSIPFATRAILRVVVSC